MTSAKIISNLADLNDVVRQYKELSGMSDRDVLAKQGGKLGREIFFQLLHTAKPKGSIREEILQRLRSGRMIKIRPEAVRQATAKWKDKLQRRQARFEDQFWGETGRGMNNWKWALQSRIVAREIAIRESGKRFLGISVRYPITLDTAGKVFSKHGPILSRSGIKVNQNGGESFFHWTGETRPSSEIAEGLTHPKPERAVLDGIESARIDILTYVVRKQKELGKAVLQKMTK